MDDRTPAPVPAEVFEAARRAWSSAPWRTVVAVAYAAGVAAGRTAAAAGPDLVRAILTGSGLANYMRIQHHTLGLHDHMGENLSCRGCTLLARAEGKTDD